MTSKTYVERRFSKKDLGEIIQRASQLAVEDSESDDETLSLAEVEDIAEELGIDRDHLHRALFRISDDDKPTGISKLWGAPFNQYLSTSLAADVSDEQWTDIVRLLRKVSGKRGASEQLGNLREWGYSISDGKINLHSLDVGVQSSGGQTYVNADTRYGGGAAISYLVSILVGVTLAGIIVDGGSLLDLPGFAIAGSGGVIGAASVRIGLSVWVARQKQRLDQVVSAVTSVLSQDAPVETHDEISRPANETDGHLDIPDEESFARPTHARVSRDKNRSH